MTVKSTIGAHRVIMPALLKATSILLIQRHRTPADDRVDREHLYDVGFALVVSARHRFVRGKA